LTYKFLSDIIYKIERIDADITDVMGAFFNLKINIGDVII